MRVFRRVFICLVVAFSMLFPVSAYAAEYGPEVSTYWGVDDFYSIIGVSNRYDAALGLIGQWSRKIQIDNAKFVALSNEGSGGAFYELANMIQPAEFELPNEIKLNAAATLVWDANTVKCLAMYGDPYQGWMWYADVTDETINAARRDFNRVMNGESLGGGGGSSGDYYEYTTYVKYVTSSFFTYPNDSTWNRVNRDGTPYEGDYSLTPNQLTIRIPVEYVDAMVQRLGSGYSAADTYVMFRRTSSGSAGTLTVVFQNSAIASSLQQGSVGERTFNYWRVTYAPNKYQSFSSEDKVFSGNVLTADTFTANVATNANYSSNFYPDDYQYYVYGMLSTGGGGSGGNNNWPDPTPPDPPQEPDPPSPTPPTVNLPDVDLPDVDFPDVDVDLPSVTIGEPTNTTSQDYTPWLRAILSALNGIITDLDSHCYHIRVAIRDNLQELAESISDTMGYIYTDLTTYLGELFEWLAERMDWTVNVDSGFDDSGIVYWLREIYYKIPGIGYPKPDPITDTEDAFDWWSALLSWITNCIVGFISGFVDDVNGLLSFVRDKFPFSIPWDVAAYLAVLDMQRETPVVVFTIPAWPGVWGEYQIRIDLSPYDNAMSAVRTMVLVWWGMVLIMRTDWLLLLFDRQTGLAKGFVSRLTGHT